MSDHVYKRVELVGSSTISAGDAICRAIETAAKTLRRVDWFEEIEKRGRVVDGKAGHSQLPLNVGARLKA